MPVANGLCCPDYWWPISGKSVGWNLRRLQDSARRGAHRLLSVLGYAKLRRSSGAAARNQSHWSARIWNSADLPRGESVGTPQILVQGSRRRAGVFLGRRSRLRWRRKIWNHSVACESRQYDGESRVGPRARTRAQHRRRHERHASRRRTGKAAVPIRAGCAHSHRLLSAKRAGRQMKLTTSTLLLLAVLALPFP